MVSKHKKEKHQLVHKLGWLFSPDMKMTKIHSKEFKTKF